MTESLTTALEQRAQPTEQKTIRELIERMKPELEKSLRSPDAAEILMRHYLTAIRLNPQLMECTSESLLAALLLSAQVRLEPGPLGHVYLIPYKQECVWMLGYTGIVELARRSERVGAIRSRVVWTSDEYSFWEDERGEHFKLVPLTPGEKDERLCVIVSWKERVGGTWHARAVEIPKSRVERAKKASRAFAKNSGPWVSDETAMWAKTGIRAVRPWLPLTPEAGYGFGMDSSRVYDLDTDEGGAAQPIVEAIESDG